MRNQLGPVPDPNRALVADLRPPPDAYTVPDVVGLAEIPPGTKDGLKVLPMASCTKPPHECTSKPPSLNAGLSGAIFYTTDPALTRRNILHADAHRSVYSSHSRHQSALWSPFWSGQLFVATAFG